MCGKWVLDLRFACSILLHPGMDQVSYLTLIMPMPRMGIDKIPSSNNIRSFYYSMHKYYSCIHETSEHLFGFEEKDLYAVVILTEVAANSSALYLLYTLHVHITSVYANKLLCRYSTHSRSSIINSFFSCHRFCRVKSVHSPTNKVQISIHTNSSCLQMSKSSKST